MNRISAPHMQPRSALRTLPVAVWVLAVIALGLLAFYVHVLQEQVQSGQRFRAQLQQSGAAMATAKPSRSAVQVAAARR